MDYFSKLGLSQKKRYRNILLHIFFFFFCKILDFSDYFPFLPNFGFLFFSKKLSICQKLVFPTKKDIPKAFEFFIISTKVLNFQKNFRRDRFLKTLQSFPQKLGLFERFGPNFIPKFCIGFKFSQKFKVFNYLKNLSKFSFQCFRCSSSVFWIRLRISPKSCFIDSHLFFREFFFLELLNHRG